jgi:hypothetical protein
VAAAPHSVDQSQSCHCSKLKSVFLPLLQIEVGLPAAAPNRSRIKVACVLLLPAPVIAPTAVTAPAPYHHKRKELLPLLPAPIIPSTPPPQSYKNLQEAK